MVPRTGVSPSALRQLFPTRLGVRTLGVILLGIGVALAAGCGSDTCTGTGCGDDAPSTGGTGSGGSSGNGMARSGPCSSDARCDTAHGFSCTAGECRYACATHFDCLGQGVCEPLKSDDGASLGTFCTLFEAPLPPGQYYTRCPKYDECDVDAGFSCLGAGVGDADAYCSARCKADPDCPTGYFCDTVSNSSGDMQLFCVRRQFCAPCEADADCLTVPGQVCASDQSGEKICTKVCDESVDSCPWGNSTVCGNWDDTLGQPTCAHRYGSCHGEGKGCEPCVRDEDCPTGFCNGSGYTGERWCIDQSVDCNCDELATRQVVCAGGNGCQRTPGGLKMSCFDSSRFADDPIAYTCFSANTNGSALASPQAGCWEAL